jgi:hypothetical protein
LIYDPILVKTLRSQAAAHPATMLPWKVHTALHVICKPYKHIGLHYLSTCWFQPCGFNKDEILRRKFGPDTEGAVELSKLATGLPKLTIPMEKLLVAVVDATASVGYGIRHFTAAATTG